MKYNSEERIVVTGIGVVTSIGNSLSEFWDNLLLGKNGVRTLLHTNVDDYYANFGGEIDIGAAITDHIRSRKMIKRLDKYIIFGCAAGRQAIIDADLDIEASPHRYATILGCGGGGVDSFYNTSREISQKGMDMSHPLGLINAIPSTGAGYFAQENNLQGPCFSVSSACATSNHAIGLAAMHIKFGMADAILAGGTEASINRLGIGAFGNIYALSKRTDDPTTAARPFNIDRDGLVLGEGAGMLCLESLTHARQRGAKIYCELSGFGFSCDAYDIVAPHPFGRGAARAMQQALKSAELNPEDIDLINAHATSTLIGDIAEYRSIQQVFGKLADTIPVHSTKSMTGHLLGGAGGAESAALILAFERGLAHQTINQFKQDPEIGYNVIQNEPLEISPSHIMSNGFGFGGQNAVLVYSRFQ